MSTNFRGLGVKIIEEDFKGLDSGLHRNDD